jgi:hypothetical protein
LVFEAKRSPSKSLGNTALGYVKVQLSCGDYYGTCNAISQDERFVHLHYYIPKYVYSVQYGRCLQFFYVMLPWHVSQVFNE